MGYSTSAEVNPYTAIFRHNKDALQDNTLKISIVESKSKDPRTWNSPTTAEVAALIPLSADIGTREIVLRYNEDGSLRYIDERAKEYLALRYPLLFPYGEPGWCVNYPLRGYTYRPGAFRLGQPHAEQPGQPHTEQPDLDELLLSQEDRDDNAQGDDNAQDDDTPQLRRGKHGTARVTMQQWYKYAIQIRDPLPLHMFAGRLFHEFVVDAFAAITSARLQWVRHNQSTLRIAQFAGLMDALHEEDRITGDQVRDLLLLIITCLRVVRWASRCFYRQVLRALRGSCITVTLTRWLLLDILVRLIYFLQ